MQAYFIKIGDKEIGPFTTKGGAVAEAKNLRKKGFEVNVSQRTISDTSLFEAFGNPESQIDLDADFGDDDDGDDDIDIDEIFGDDDDDDADDDDDDKDDDADDDKDDDKPGADDADEAPDDKPDGAHPWYRSFGKGA